MRHLHAARRRTPLWSDENWTLHPPVGGSLPGAVWIASREHFDSFADMPDEVAADFAGVVARAERAILALGDVGRVHLYRWGDGGAHFHVWLIPRPLGMVEAAGMMLPLWEDVLPNVSDEELAAAAHARRRRDVTHGRALARKLGTRDAVVIGLGSMIGAGVFSAFAPAAAAAGQRAADRPRDRRGRRVLQRGRVGAARRAVPDLRRHVRLRPRAARRVVGLPGRLGVRDRQDRVVRRDGADLRVVCRHGTALAAARGSRCSRSLALDGRQLPRHHAHRRASRGCSSPRRSSRWLVVVVAIATSGARARRRTSATCRRSAPAARTASSRRPGCSSSPSPATRGSPRSARRCASRSARSRGRSRSRSASTVCLYLVVAVAALLAAGPEALAASTTPLTDGRPRGRRRVGHAGRAGRRGASRASARCSH